MGVSAKVIAHSKSSVTGKEIITFELEFPRLVLAEFNTHNALSKNSSSSRAIPVEKMIDQVIEDPAMPVRFGKKNKGMQDAGEHSELIGIYHVGGQYEGEYTAEDAWKLAGKIAAGFAISFNHSGYAKQICNRLIEPFQQMKVVMTATELNNFIWLRDHPAADPTIEALAKAIKKAKEESEPFVLNPGEWHLPYVDRIRDCLGNIMYLNGELPEYSAKTQVLPTVSLEDAIAISVSCCAQVSFRSLDDSLEKAHSVVEKLNLKGKSEEPVHASPTEHQATPMKATHTYGKHPDLHPSDKPTTNHPSCARSWEEGITHVDRDGTLCSGNLKGWIQYRQLIPNNVKLG